ncbi:hypothetical protein D3C81_1567420 [compost metagenome]
MYLVAIISTLTIRFNRRTGLARYPVAFNISMASSTNDLIRNYLLQITSSFSSALFRNDLTYHFWLGNGYLSSIRVGNFLNDMWYHQLTAISDDRHSG